MHQQPKRPYKHPKKKRKVAYTTVSIRVPTDCLTKVREVAVKCGVKRNAIICDILAWGVGWKSED